MKNPQTLAGIEPAIFQFVAQYLNHCATAVPIRSMARGFSHHERVQTISEVHLTSYSMYTGDFPCGKAAVV